jgi:hypothetical protein
MSTSPMDLMDAGSCLQAVQECSELSVLMSETSSLKSQCVGSEQDGLDGGRQLPAGGHSKGKASVGSSRLPSPAAHSSPGPACSQQGMPPAGGMPGCMSGSRQSPQASPSPSTPEPFVQPAVVLALHHHLVLVLKVDAVDVHLREGQSGRFRRRCWSIGRQRWGSRPPW